MLENLKSKNKSWRNEMKEQFPVGIFICQKVLTNSKRESHGTIILAKVIGYSNFDNRDWLVISGRESEINLDDPRKFEIVKLDIVT